ncbi:thioredoxin domain-containing protein [Sphingobacterium sp. SGR-19]|uniref:thioredoxin domain-containing protein n=1 Tax=Sphingobacterium sp. SGR-19 TaxID=2710886 RepID=UPI0013EB7088|nr:thioredoxin domain-containing protein [Sphingobacterium sp. SGR-19]NGM64877.1 thioredoxin [Sphingobacterium sp. SGR-19]
MKLLRYDIIVLLLVTVWSGCGSNRTDEQKSSDQLTAQTFADKIEEVEYLQLVDVRTPEEFEKGHIEGAINIDWNGTDFTERIAKLDTEKPVFVYCLSGGRSSKAVEKLEEMGFGQIYELPGGMMEWRANNLPESTTSETAVGMNMQQYQALVKSDKLVLVDFYADWCAPCKKMEPFLNSIAADMEDRLTLVRIDADANPALCQELGVEALPYLKLYQGDGLMWEHLGFIEEPELRKQLK